MRYMAVTMLLLAARISPADTTLLDGVAACVNGRTVTVSDVMAALEPDRRSLTGRYEGADLSRRLRDRYRETVDQLVDRELILMEYEKGKLRIPDQAVMRREAEVLNERFDNDRSALLKALAEDRIPYEEWKARLREQMIVGAMRHENVDRHVQVSPAAARKFYDENPARFSTPGRVRLRMIFVAPGGDESAAKAAREQAEAAMERLRKGEDFAAVARAVSQDAKAEQGGDWGWLDPELLQPRLAAAARTLQPRQYCGPVQTDAGLYILMCDGREEPARKTFEEVREQIERELEEAERARLSAQWTRRLREKAHVLVTGDCPF